MKKSYFFLSKFKVKQGARLEFEFQKIISKALYSEGLGYLPLSNSQTVLLRWTHEG